MSVKQFCREQGLTEYSFYAWRKRLREQGPVRFALVERSAAGAHAGGGAGTVVSLFHSGRRSLRSDWGNGIGEFIGAPLRAVHIHATALPVNLTGCQVPVWAFLVSLISTHPPSGWRIIQDFAAAASSIPTWLGL